MNRTYKKAVSTVILLCLMFASLATATEDAYITENDPLVSLSYITDVLTPSVEKKIAEAIEAAGTGLSDAEKQQLTASITASVSENIQNELLASSEFKTLLGDIVAQELAKHSVGGSSASSDELYTLTLSMGQKLTATGKCEIILQSGSAVIFCPNSASVKDITSGEYKANGVSVIKGHYIEITSGNGSGIAATWNETVIAVRGEFKVEG